MKVFRKLFNWFKYKILKINSPSEVCKKELEPIVTSYALVFLKYAEPIIKGFEDGIKETEKNKKEE